MFPFVPPTPRKLASPRWMLSLAVALLASSGFAADPYFAAREQMVRQHILSAGINNPRVIQAMRATPRHEFLAANQRELAYYDMAIPIGHGQTISPPYIVAFMTAQLNPQPTDKVLEIGTGSGYQAAVLSPLVKDVYTIEIVEPLGQRAAEVLRRLGYANVHPKIGDGYAGWPEHAPFDKIIVTCSPEDIPQPLIDQLAEGGQIMIPVGERFQQTLVRLTKKGTQLEREPLQATFFVPMTGESEEQRRVKPDNTQPGLAEGSFEATIGDTDQPAAWYYIREGKVVAAADAPDGGHVMEFNNQVAGRSAHALQSFGVDGSVVKRLEVRAWIRGQRIRPGPQRDQVARLIIEFYSKDRATVGHVVLGPWSGSFDWREQVQTIAVPPAAQLGVVGIGLFGATGVFSVDQVSLAAR